MLYAILHPWAQLKFNNISWHTAYCYTTVSPYNTDNRRCVPWGVQLSEDICLNMSTMVCTVCDGNITDKAMKAGDKLYHEEHFTCCLCGTSLAGPGVATYTKHEKLYCHDDYMRQFVPVCAKCNDYITQVKLKDIYSFFESNNLKIKRIFHILTFFRFNSNGFMQPRSS